MHLRLLPSEEPEKEKASNGARKVKQKKDDEEEAKKKKSIKERSVEGGERETEKRERSVRY